MVIEIMFHKLIDAYEYWIVAWLGYEKAVRVEEFMNSASTFVLGMLTMALISSFFIIRLHSVEDFGKSKVKLVRVDHGEKSQLVLHIHNIWSAFETLLFLSFSPFCTIKRFTERDARRTRRFLISIEILVAIILIVASVSIFSVLEPIPEMESVSLVCKMIKS